MRIALSCLYGDDVAAVDGTSTTSTTIADRRREAHDFLLALRSSNSRRYVHSRMRSRKDREARRRRRRRLGDRDDDDDDDGPPDGSVFLACLSLLLRRDATDRERIFASQILNHRCRSLKLSEALDLEAEDGIGGGTARLVEAWEGIREDRSRLSSTSNELRERSDSILNAWIGRYEPMLVHRCAAAAAAAVGHDDAGGDWAGLLAKVVMGRHPSLLLHTKSFTPPP